MSLLAILSDIHGNFEALEAVVKHARGIGIQRFACLGDIVGYGPNPAECVRAVSALAEVIVRGNHEHAIFSEDYLSQAMTDTAAESTLCTRKMLTERELDLIKDLPVMVREGKRLFVHACVPYPEDFDYVFDCEEMYPYVGRGTTIFFGHTHDSCFEMNMPVNSDKVPEDAILVINPGSVGAPRMHYEPCASYVVFETSTRGFNLFEIGYDHEKTKAKIDANPFYSDSLKAEVKGWFE